jgi:hypothetical protein
LQPARLPRAGLRQAAEQFLGLGFKTSYRGKISFGVAVCHGPLSAQLPVALPALLISSLDPACVEFKEAGRARAVTPAIVR